MKCAPLLRAFTFREGSPPTVTIGHGGPRSAPLRGAPKGTSHEDQEQRQGRPRPAARASGPHSRRLRVGARPPAGPLLNARRAAARVVASLFALSIASTVEAHPLSFGLLELRDDGARVRVTWRFSGTERSAAGATPVLPPWCREVEARVTEALPEGVSERATLDCGARGLVGADVAVRGLEHTGVQIIVRHVTARGVDEAVLDDTHRTWTVPGTRSRLRTLSRYLALGLEHIATGWDHLAFVAVLSLVARTRRRLLTTITAFTLGHSVTLALATLGVARAPQRAVECAIAWSIVVTAREALLRERDTTPRHDAPWAIAALFGLLHGFGFAGALGEVGLARDAVVTALVGFNVGVELGQLAFVALGLALAAVVTRVGASPHRARTALAYAAGLAGAWWCLERGAAMLRA